MHHSSFSSQRPQPTRQGTPPRPGFRLILAALLGGAELVAASADAPARRFMPFLARDAVVRESTAVEVLASPDAPIAIVTEPAGAGALQIAENRNVAKAAAVLAEYFQKAADVTAAPGAARRVVLHTPATAAAQFPELARADAHGFVLATRGRDLHIAGGSGIGTLYGVWFFLQNYIGVRILMHGELGEVVPRQAQITLPRELYVFNPGPDFLLRIHSGLQQLDPTAWLQDRGAHPGSSEAERRDLESWDSQRFFYHHSAFRIYDPERFGASHPEYYPILNGKRYIPAPTIRSGWQPAYSEPAVVERAIAYADEQFTANPHLKAISLTPNDGGGWAAQDLQRAKELGVPIREIFFEYLNRVARGIRARWPDRFVSALAYLEYQEPPSFPLEDNCMIFIWTQDGNIQPVFDRWKGKARHFGNYQWIYGPAYPFPNHWPHAFQEFLNLLRGYGTRAFKSEFYDVHGNGAVRLWVVANLLWNTNADVDAILRDYYEHAYGREAAPAMARYFAQWEKVYERRRKPREFNLVNRTGGERKFETITEADMVECSRALQEARQAAVGEANRQRVDIVARLFERAQHYYDMYRNLMALRAGPEKPTTLAEGSAQLAAAAGMLAAEQRVYACNVERLEPLAAYCLMPPSGAGEKNRPWPINYGQLDPRVLHVTSDARWVLEDQRIARIARHVTSLLRTPASIDPAVKYWRQAGEDYPILRPYADAELRALSQPDIPLANVLPNGSFELPARPHSADAIVLLRDMRTYKVGFFDADHCEVPFVARDGWNAVENRCPERVKVVADRSEKRHGDVAMRVESVGQFGGLITQVTLPSPRARYRLSFWHKGPAGGKIQYGFTFYQIRPVPYLWRTQEAAKEWTKVEVEFPFNHDLARDEDAVMTLQLGIAGGVAGKPVWFDDVRLERLAP